MTTMVYKSRKEANMRQDRKQDVIDRELEAMMQSLGRVPTSAELLEAASAPTHPLHAYITWDDREAAHEYRLLEAYRLIQSCKFVVELNERQSKRFEVRKFLSLERGEPMRLRNEALAEPDARLKMKAQAIGELRSWCRRYVDLSELDAIRSAIEKLL